MKLQFAKEHSSKKKWSNILMKTWLFFLGLGAADSLSDDPHTRDSSHSTLKTVKHDEKVSWYGDWSQITALDQNRESAYLRHNSSVLLQII